MAFEKDCSAALLGKRPRIGKWLKLDLFICSARLGESMGTAAKSVKKNELKRDQNGFSMQRDPEINLGEQSSTNSLTQSKDLNKGDLANLELKNPAELNSNGSLGNTVKLRIVHSPYARETSGSAVETTLPEARKFIYNQLDLREFILMVGVPFALVSFLVGARIAFVILTSPKISLPELIWKTIWIF